MSDWIERKLKKLLEEERSTRSLADELAVDTKIVYYRLKRMREAGTIKLTIRKQTGYWRLT